MWAAWWAVGKADSTAAHWVCSAAGTWVAPTAKMRVDLLAGQMAALRAERKVSKLAGYSDAKMVGPRADCSALKLAAKTAARMADQMAW